MRYEGKYQLLEYVQGCYPLSRKMKPCQEGLKEIRVDLDEI